MGRRPGEDREKWKGRKGREEKEKLRKLGKIRTVKAGLASLGYLGLSTEANQLLSIDLASRLRV